MNAEARDRILDRVRKMLRLATDAGATEGERDNAMRMAHATLAKYNLDIASIESREAASNDDRRDEHEAIFGGWPWARRICASVADLYFCHYLSGRGNSEHSRRHYFVGREANAVTAALVAEFVVKAVYREAMQQWRENPPAEFMLAPEITGRYRTLAGLPGRADFLRSFGWGAAQHIRARVAALKTDARQVDEPTTDGPPGKALQLLGLVYRAEDEANSRFIAKRSPWIEKRKPRKARTIGVSASAFERGEAYGDTVSLSPQLKSES